MSTTPGQQKELKVADKTGTGTLVTAFHDAQFKLNQEHAAALKSLGQIHRRSAEIHAYFGNLGANGYNQDLPPGIRSQFDLHGKSAPFQINHSSSGPRDYQVAFTYKQQEAGSTTETDRAVFELFQLSPDRTGPRTLIGTITATKTDYEVSGMDIDGNPVEIKSSAPREALRDFVLEFLPRHPGLYLKSKAVCEAVGMRMIPGLTLTEVPEGYTPYLQRPEVITPSSEPEKKKLVVIQTEPSKTTEPSSGNGILSRIARTLLGSTEQFAQEAPVTRPPVIVNGTDPLKGLDKPALGKLK